MTHLRLDNLPAPDSVAMVAEMLRVDPAAAAGLVEVIEPRTGGNPYETVEVLNALRSQGLLIATAAGWQWDAAAARAHLGHAEIDAMVATRVQAMPAASREIVEAMACLGGRAEVTLLQIATGASAGAVDRSLAPALEEGLLVMEPGAGEAVRFRHDRIREVVLAGLDPERRRALQLLMGRRLAGVPELFAAAAEQYLPVVDAVDDATERRVVVGLFRRGAEQAGLIGDHALVNALLAAALRLIDPGETATLIEVRTGRHAALYSIGRLEEADEEYRTIERLSTTALERADATCVQVNSLTHRKRFAEAITLGLDSLRECGIAVPAAERRSAELDHQFQHLYRWLDQHPGSRRPGPAGDHRPDAARRDPAAQRDRAGDLLRRPRHVRLAEPGGAPDLARARHEPEPGRPGQHRRPRRGGAARRLRRRVPDGAAGSGAGGGPRLRARQLAGALDVRSPGRLVRAAREHGQGSSTGPGRADRRRRADVRRLHLLPDRLLPA